MKILFQMGKKQMGQDLSFFVTPEPPLTDVAQLADLMILTALEAKRRVYAQHQDVLFYADVEDTRGAVVRRFERERTTKTVRDITSSSGVTEAEINALLLAHAAIAGLTDVRHRERVVKLLAERFALQLYRDMAKFDFPQDAPVPRVPRQG